MASSSVSHDFEARRLIAEARKAPYLARGEDLQLGRLALAGGLAGERARSRLVDSHQRLVVSIALQYLKSGKPLCELIADGRVGLVQAANKYDPERGNNFATLATWWIRAAVQLSAYGANDSADMPPSAKRKLYKIQKAERSLLDAGDDPTDEAIAAKLKLSVVTVQRLREAAPRVGPTVSLDAVIGEGKTTIGDMIADPSSADPDQQLQHDELKSALNAAMANLDDRERIIVSMRFGLVDDQEATLSELSDRYGISRERVRQIEMKALQKIASGPHAGLLRTIMTAL